MKIDLKKEITLPKFGRGRSSSRPSLGGGPSIQPPKVLADLYADLRDRHLLPLVALLLVAIVAAPFLLKSGGDGTKSVPPVASPVVGETSDSSFTVVPAERDLRSPEKRLGHRQALNPFRQPNHGSAEGGDQSSSSHSSSSGSGSKATSNDSGAIEVSGSESTTVVAPIETTPVEVSTPPAPAPTKTTEKTDVTINNEVVGYAVSMETGTVPGELNEQTAIQPMTAFPSEKEPLLLFVGLLQGQQAGPLPHDQQGDRLLRGRPLHDRQGSLSDGRTRSPVNRRRSPTVSAKANRLTRSSSARSNRSSAPTSRPPRTPARAAATSSRGNGKKGSGVGGKPSGAGGNHPSQRGAHSDDAIGVARRFSK